ncbi:cache domain-containing protein [Nitratidesulfovibrio liaohensis]|uniref:cache domain-containing protein n=1 Tax=Nitratidesulfovibrio liaohensis TaxID=2604158 RepID=UPI001421F83C|nr:cache domain-containing protein [Nitratidesulfovibrio liaohensis]NHZ45275.1 response regulator [Nitratidesulfovibrio liaohensis]
MRSIKKYIPLLSYSVISRIALLVVFMIVFATAISFVYSFYINKTLEETQIAARQMMLENMRRTLRTSVQSMTGSIAEIIKYSDESKERAVQNIVNHAKYDDNGYFFAYSTNGTNVAHPIFPDFQGQQRLETEDDTGTKYIRELTEKAISGGGFVQYNFYKPGESFRRTKLVYALLIPETDFWLGSGLYIDDINRDQQTFSDIFTKIHRRAIFTVGTGVALLLVFVVAPISLIMINSILKPWRQLERELMQAQKMEAVGIFAGGIAHDFGNVLGAISSCAALALMDIPPGSPAHDDLEHISKAAKRGKNLVRRIKNFSSKADAPRQPVNLARIAHECTDFVQTLIPASIEVRRRIEDHDIWVEADPDQLLQIIMNLCTNAEQAMRGFNGVLTVELAAVELDDDEARTMGLQVGSYARLSVTDNGVGMKPVIIKRIFEPFYTTRKKSGGTGLGLSMTKSIVTMHGGAITVASAPGKGSTFHVLLPCATPSEEHTLHERHLELPEGTEHIMLLDDDSDLIASLHRLFSRVGYTVTSCLDSTKALDIFSASPGSYDLIITDQLMPKMNGTEFIRRVRKIRPDIPVILCSGFEGDGLLNRVPTDLEKAGVSAFFRKPFDTVEICRGVREVLDSTPSRVQRTEHHAANTHHR